MSKIKNKDEFKERDEIEEYFSEVKNKSFPTGIIFLILLLLLIGCLSYYYFVIDNPKNIFLTLVNNKLTNLKTNYNSHEKINYEFNLDLDIETNNKKYLDTINILNNIAVKGTGGLDLNQTKNYTKLNAFYQGEKLLTLDTYYQNNQILYLKSEELFDKIIKVNFKKQTSEENKNKQEYNLNIDNLKELSNSLIDTLRPLLSKANYKKEYTNLNNTLVKKITITIDKSFKENFYNSILDNNNFLTSFSKLQGITKSKLIESLNKELNNLDNDIDELSLYTSILENKVLSLEIIHDDDDRVILSKEDNQYNYKIYDDSIIEYLGYIKLTKTNNDYEITFSVEDIKRDLNIELNLDAYIEYDKDINSLDNNNAIDYKSLTKQDINKITDNINKNKNFTNIIEDIKPLFKSNKDELPKETTE